MPVILSREMQRQEDRELMIILPLPYTARLYVIQSPHKIKTKQTPSSHLKGITRNQTKVETFAWLFSVICWQGQRIKAHRVGGKSPASPRADS